ncbi:MAG: DUF5615 family PIN-like protein [Chloroflexi bacterium]|nr:DUF5615 family PIN-like protein [Chloroflexota bacterium]
MRLLLDAHVPSAVAQSLAGDGIDILTLEEWQRGAYRDAPDHDLLVAAHADARVLITYDCRTLPELLKVWAETGRPHSSVILMDERTIRQGDVGGLVRALRLLIQRDSQTPWTDRAVFLRRA